MQLDFFPRTEFNSLPDFQKVEKNSVTISEIRQLITNPSFFKSPKNNIVFKRQHSEILDRILGFRPKYIEEMLVAQAMDFDPEGSHETWGPSLHDGIQTWVGLEIETLQTPYSECLRILQLLKIKPYQHIVDLGAAYGRMGVVIGGLYLKNFFTGLEYVKARVDEGNRIYRELNLSRCELKEQNLFCEDFILPQADIYFIYDYGQVHHITHTLNQIMNVAHKRPIKLVVHGKFTKEIIKKNFSYLEPIYEGRWDDGVTIYSVFFV